MRASQRILTASMQDESPVFNLQAYAPIGENHYSAVFSSTKRTRPFSFENYRDKVVDTFDGKLTLAADSLFAAENCTFRAILAPLSESKKFEEDKLKDQGFKALAASLYEDNSKNIWKIVGEGDAKQLIRVTSEDYDRLLRARRSSLPMHAAEKAFVQPQFGDYAYAFVPELRAFDFGVYGKTKDQPFIVSRRFKKKFKVDDVQILEAATANPALRMEMKRKWSDVADRKGLFAEYLEFMAMLYGKNSEYYRANEDAIMNSRVQ